MADINANTTRKNQRLVGAAIIVVIAISLVALLWLVDSGTPSPKNDKPKSNKTSVKHPVNQSALQTHWQDVINEQVANDTQQTEKVAQELVDLKAINDAQQAVLEEQSRELQSMKQQLLSLQKSDFESTSALLPSPVPHPVEVPPVMQVTQIKLITEDKDELPKTIKNYVPSGSFIEAILLGGLDAHAGVNAQSDPHPVLLRVLDNGVLPNNRNSQLENCRIIGAGYGDISSERAFIRLERMSCEQQGFFTDYPVYGYVTGPDGKDGIRGRVVIRDKEVVSKAFMGGFLGGLSDAATSSFTTQSISPLGSVETVKSSDILAYSGAEGVGNAMEMYAKYNIKRAEMYQPVIEIPAGTKVNVVFNRGFYLDGLGVSDPGKLKASKNHETFLIETPKSREDEDSEPLFK